MRRLAASAVLSCLAGVASAQTAQINLTCEIIAATVDGVSSGAIEDPAFEISISPTDVIADGSGFYELTYEGETYKASNLSGAGPLVWSVSPGNASVLTIPTADGIYVLHDYWAITQIPSTTRFLVCEVG